MHLPSRRRIKRELNRRLIYHPLLRMLLFKVWFRAAFVLFVGALVFFSLYLPKVWRTSPEGFTPVIKVSGLDLTQAWSLKRTAKRAMAQGDRVKANFAWQSAVANNPADAGLIRGFLNYLIQAENLDRRSTSVGLAETLWLLRLTQTNTTDLDLCVRFYEKTRSFDVLQYVCGPVQDRLSPSANVAYTKALFHLGKIGEFEARLKRLPASMAANMQPYQWAYLAGWGTGPDSTEGLQSLRKGVKQSGFDETMSRLYLAVCAKRLDASGYSESLEMLARRNLASVLDHVNYWRVLRATGRKGEATALAEAFTTSPQSAVETIRLAEIFYVLGLSSQARDVLKRFAPQFGNFPEVWSSYASLLEEQREWREMRAAAEQIQKLPGVRESLNGLSYYLQGRANLAEGRRRPAEAAFEASAKSTYETLSIALLVANELTRLDFPQFARAILQPLQASARGSMEYSQAAFNAAYRLRDAAWLLQTASESYHANPSDSVLLNRYAAALILNRAQPQEAVKLTFQLVNVYPDSEAVRINHAMALLQNGRITEAQNILKSMNSAALSSSESTSYYLALFEANLNLSQLSEARKAAARIDRSHLFPNQIKWLEEKISTLPSEAGKA